MFREMLFNRKPWAPSQKHFYFLWRCSMKREILWTHQLYRQHAHCRNCALWKIAPFAAAQHSANWNSAQQNIYTLAGGKIAVVAQRFDWKWIYQINLWQTSWNGDYIINSGAFKYNIVLREEVLRLPPHQYAHTRTVRTAFVIIWAMRVCVYFQYRGALYTWWILIALSRRRSSIATAK